MRPVTGTEEGPLRTTQRDSFSRLAISDGLLHVGIAGLASAAIGIIDNAVDSIIIAVISGVSLGVGVVGFTIATTCCAYLNALALRFTLDRRAGHAAAFPWSRTARTVLASSVMMIAAFGLQDVITATTRTERALWQLGLPVLGGITVYGLVQLLLRSPEIAAVRARLLGR